MEFIEILENVSCGSINLDSALPAAVSTIIGLIKIFVPMLVVLFGLIDLGKAVTQQKEDDIKKSQGLLIKRIILAAIVFFVISLVQFVVGIVGGTNEKNWGCFECFVNGKCNGVPVKINS